MRRRITSILAGLGVGLAMSGCTGSATGDSAPPTGPPPAPPDSTATTSADAAAELSGRAATAKDLHYTAAYEWAPARREAVEITVSVALDGSWRVDVPGGAHGGRRDVTMIGNKRGVFQCELGERRECVAVAAAGEPVPSAADPLVQHPFTDWLDLLLDRRNPFSIAAVDAPEDVDEPGACFSVERNAVTVAAPIPPTVYCLREDGVITWIESSFGTLRLTGPVGEPDERTRLPGDVVDATPLATSPPPKPTPTPDASAKSSRSPEDDDRSG
ncbi:hypothetical protein LX16_2781 [Stackebrandtia albiflava]|uniref:Lipoprotein n=1 Tax=Stackebrandtia albiflava TaxID=406432 RepID=A0A562V2F7_9ACTN|nr:hypothetical protein [Stackebrandtia albiflava]TWJ12035.1 hypothetical protein LX16_2781 [Stackebrandtia albiflava]